MLVKTTDGTPDAVKVARPVWSGGKSGDNFKGLPITIGGNAALLCLDAFTADLSKPEFERFGFW